MMYHRLHLRLRVTSTITATARLKLCFFLVSIFPARERFHGCGGAEGSARRPRDRLRLEGTFVGTTSRSPAPASLDNFGLRSAGRDPRIVIDRTADEFEKSLPLRVHPHRPEPSSTVSDRKTSRLNGMPRVVA